MQATTRDFNQETVDIMKAAFTKSDISKAGITVGTGLVGYELAAPSKKLYPVLSPLRNRFARVMAPQGSLAAHWKAITGINTGNVKAAVAFGTRNANLISYAEQDKLATYKSLGLDSTVDDEAVWLGRGFEDVRAYDALATLQALMIEEEKILLGAVSSANAFGTPATPTSQRTATAGGAWTTTDNAYCKVVALPLYGWLNSDVTGLTNLNGDHSVASAVKSQALTATTDSVQFATTQVDGAVAYAWFTAEASATPADSALKLSAVTTVPAVSLTAAGAGVALASVAGYTGGALPDTSGDTNVFDGVLPQLVNPNVSYTVLDSSYSSGTLKMASGGTAPTSTILFEMNANLANPSGTQLTSDNAGGVVEFDVLLQALWDQARIGPTLALMNSRDAKGITKIIGGSTSGLVSRFPVDPGTKDLTGGIFFSGYLNKFTSSLTPGMPDVIPFMIHPFLPPGSIMFLSERLPYPNNNVENVFEVETQQEYTDFEWARVQRTYAHGVYAMEVLKVFFPAGCGIIRGIAKS